MRRIVTNPSLSSVAFAGFRVCFAGVFTALVRLGMRKVLVLAIVLTVSACADSHRMQHSIQSPEKLSRAATAYVAVP
jgi:hypothetical protein